MNPSERYLMKEGKERFGESLYAVLGSKAKHSPPKQSVTFKCKKWAKITKKFAKKCPDASSL